MEMKYESFSFIHEATVKKCLFLLSQKRIDKLGTKLRENI